MNEAKKYGRIHKEMLDSLEHLSEEKQGLVILAYCRYMIYGVEPDSKNELVYSLFKNKQFDLDAIKRDIETSQDNWRKWGAPLWNSNAVKTWEIDIKQPRNNPKQPNHNPETTQNNPETTEQEQEQEQEQEHIKKERDKSLSKERESLPTVLQLVEAYRKNERLSKQIPEEHVKRWATYKQSKKSTAYKTLDGFIQQLHVYVNTVSNWSIQLDTWLRFGFALNQTIDNWWKGIVRDDKIESQYKWRKKIYLLQKQNE